MRLILILLLVAATQGVTSGTAAFALEPRSQGSGLQTGGEENVAPKAAARTERLLDLSGFREVHASAGVDVFVTIGGAHRVILETDGDPDRAVAKLDGDALILSRKARKGYGVRLGERYTYRVTMPMIAGALSEAGAELRIDGITGGDLTFTARSGGDLEASGDCAALRAAAASGAELRAMDLVCRSVDAEVQSGASALVYAADALRGRAKSGGRLVVRGQPGTTEVRKSSGGLVRFER